MLGLGTIGQFAIGEQPAGSAEFITPDKYIQALSEPQRQRAALLAAAQAAFFMQPSPVVPFDWRQWLSEPQRQRPRSPAALAPAFFLDPAVSPFVATGWFAPLSEPVRARRRLLEALQQFFAIDPTVIPTSHIETWYQALSEPQRSRIWLLSALQQAWTGPNQLRPTPDFIAVMQAVEQFDTMVAGAYVFNSAASGEIGIVTNPYPATEIGISSGTPSGGTIVSGTISIS